MQALVQKCHAGALCIGLVSVAFALLTSSCSQSSDDAPLIAYSTFYASDDVGDVYVVNPETRDDHKLTRGWNVSWSPEGDRLVFVDGSDDDFSDLWVINRDGTERRLLAKDGNRPAWSPAGDEIAFLRRTANGEGRDIHVVDMESGVARRLTYSGSYTWSPVWSPDGTHLAAEETRDDLQTQVVLINRDGSDKRVLARPPPRPPEHSQHDTGPVWSPDGKQIAFDRSLADNDGGVFEHHMYVIGSNGAGLRQLTGDGGFGPAWSPDGRQIAYGVDGNIYVVGADGSGRLRLTDSGTDSAPEWSPDGSQIAFLSTRADRPDLIYSYLYVMDADGSNEVRLGHAATEDVPAWSSG